MKPTKTALHIRLYDTTDWGVQESDSEHDAYEQLAVDAIKLRIPVLAPAYLKPRLENAANIAKAIRYAAAKHGIEANSGEPHEVTWT